jgi:cytochrome c556
MPTRVLVPFLIFSSMVASAVTLFADDPPTPHHQVELSPELLTLLTAEMRAQATGAQSVALALATADWQSIQDTSSKMQASYIMEKNLTPAQVKELAQALPAHFKQLDAEFHQRAARLGAAAAAHDPELVAFHYSHLVESCARCHAAYARARFPGFAPPVQQGHHH